MADLVIKNGKIVTPDEVISLGIAVDKGKVVAISKEEYLPSADRTIDATGKYILPGLVDPHVHGGGIFENVPVDEVAKSETKAMALGGVTTCGIYLNPVKQNVLEAAKDYKKKFEANSFADGFFHVFLVNENIVNDISKCVDYGIYGFKFSFGYKGPQADLAGMIYPDDGFAYDAFRKISDIGYPAMALAHCENIDIILRLRKPIEATGRQDALAWFETRPNFCEEESIRRVMFLANAAKCPLYIVHNTIGESVTLFAQAKAAGQNVIMETCPQYLTHNIEEPAAIIENNPPFSVVNPPLRKKWDNERLWEGIKQGVVDTIGSDLAPETKEEKGTDMWKAVMGVGNTSQMILPVMLSEGVNKKRISLEKVVQVCCRNAAKAFDIYPKKGSISVGSDADIVIVDLDKKVTMKADMTPSICGWTVYEGWEFTGWPVMTILRGQIIMEEGKILVEPGIGRYTH